MSPWPASVAAPAAAAWLAATGTARVLNVFDRACNLVNARGEVLAVVTSERGLTPFALVVTPPDPAPFAAITAASAVRARAGWLSLGPLEMEASTARRWDATPAWPAIRAVAAQPARWAALAGLALGQGPAGSLLELWAPGGRGGALPAMLRERALRGALALVNGLSAGALEPALDGVSLLAGAGGGLTPAGDDFILGALLAVWAGAYGAGAERLAPALAEAAAARTTTLSGAYVRAAARGECSIYWHALLQAWASPAPAQLPAALAALLAVGHTSGADALAGFLALRFCGPNADNTRRLSFTYHQ